MIKYSIRKNGIITNSWTSDYADSNYHEPSFGQPGDYELITEDIGNTLALAKLRVKRDGLLKECDWTQISDSPLNSDKKTEWATYRQVLRDLPENTDPSNPTYPTKPS